MEGRHLLVGELIASIGCGVLFEIQHLQEHDAHFQVMDLLWFILPVLVFSLPGWVLALPIILGATDFRSWRFWFYFAIGGSIGPIVMLGLALYGRLTDPRSDGFWGNTIFLVLATAVSSVTTLIYLLLIRAGPEVRASN